MLTEGCRSSIEELSNNSTTMCRTEDEGRCGSKCSVTPEALAGAKRRQVYKIGDHFSLRGLDGIFD